MTWDHRIIKKVDEEGEAYYQIHEVYYSEMGKPIGRTEEACQAIGLTVADLHEDLEMMMAAFDKLPLSDEDIDYVKFSVGPIEPVLVISPDGAKPVITDPE